VPSTISPASNAKPVYTERHPDDTPSMIASVFKRSVEEIRGALSQG
jgi:hypothetical protein